MVSRGPSGKRARFGAAAERSGSLRKKGTQDYCESCGNFGVLRLRDGQYLCSSCRLPQPRYKRSRIKGRVSKRSKRTRKTRFALPREEYWEFNPQTGRWNKKARTPELPWALWKETVELKPMPLTELRKILRKLT